MTKEKQYKALVKEIQNCHCCEHIKVPIYDSDGEFLTNVNKDKYPEMDQANMWNYWQGSLDADIMMIGQDFGTLPKRISDRGNLTKKDKGYCSFEECINGVEWRTQINDETTAKKHWGVTDANIWKLFYEIFQLNVTEEQNNLFFTNMACCYRHNVISGNRNFRPEWLTLCANKYMGRLIAIIKPKIIIALGENVFNGLACMEEYELTCADPTAKKGLDKKKSSYEETIRHTYWLEKEKNKARVFPVYHPGSYSTVNRPMTKEELQKRNKRAKSKKKITGYQMDDWQKIEDYYNTIK